MKKRNLAAIGMGVVAALALLIGSGAPSSAYDAELIQRTVIGTAHGMAKEPGDVSLNQAHVIWAYPDGSTMLLKSEGSSAVNAAGARITAGTKTCVGGTGRFADADCTINWSLVPQGNGMYGGSFTAIMMPKALS